MTEEYSAIESKAEDIFDGEAYLESLADWGINKIEQVMVQSPNLRSSDDTESDNTMETNEESVNTGIHFYGETVSQTMSTTNMLDFIKDIFIQYDQGYLPKTTPEETAELLKKWFDGSLSKDVQSQFYEQSTPSVESRAEQFVCNVLKRPRVDSNV